MTKVPLTAAEIEVGQVPGSGPEIQLKSEKEFAKQSVWHDGAAHSER